MESLLTIRRCGGAAELRPISAVFFLLVLFLSARGLPAQTVRIAAASDLQFALGDLAAQYEKQSGARLAITYGSSGNFFAQIQNGAPFDLFFSADVAYPQRLIEGGYAEADSLSTYAFGRLVLWLPPESPLDPAKLQWSTLSDARVQKIAIANPDHAPYGRAAVAALQKTGFYEQVRSKLVYGENISQAAQFVVSDSAQAGILAMSIAVAPSMKSGKIWEIPRDSYPPIEQAVVLVKSSPNKAAANRFLAFLKTESARANLARYGFSVPEASRSSEAKP